MAEKIKYGGAGASLQAIEKWREASDLAATALPKALDNQAVIFRLGSLMGDLAASTRQK